MTKADNAVYELYGLEPNPIKLIPQKFKKALVHEPAFKNLFLLYRVKDGKNQYRFNLTGNEYVSVTSSSDTKPVVDGAVISDASIDIKFGVDREDNAIAYKSIKWLY